MVVQSHCLKLTEIGLHMIVSQPMEAILTLFSSLDFNDSVHPSELTNVLSSALYLKYCVRLLLGLFVMSIVVIEILSPEGTFCDTVQVLVTCN